LDKYIIAVVEEHNSVIAILRSSHVAEVVRESTGRYPGYEVEIRETDLKVLRSNYIR
jgi:hypothetical protein